MIREYTVNLLQLELKVMTTVSRFSVCGARAPDRQGPSNMFFSLGQRPAPQGAERRTPSGGLEGHCARGSDGFMFSSTDGWETKKTRCNRLLTKRESVWKQRNLGIEGDVVSCLYEFFLVDDISKRFPMPQAYKIAAKERKGKDCQPLSACGWWIHASWTFGQSSLQRGPWEL